MLWPDSVLYRPVDTLDARAASDAARVASSLPCALVELLPTAARRASGSAPRASARRALHGLVDDRGPRAAPHVLATAPPLTARARTAVVLPTGRERCACSGHTWSSAASLIRQTHGPRRTTLARRPRYCAHPSSCCRPPRGGRRAALLVLRLDALSTGSLMTEALGRRRTYLLRRHLPLHALARPSFYRRAASAARALAGLGLV